MCSWESRQPPKLLHGVRLLALVLMSRWCSGFALDPPKVQALVQIQVGILIQPASVPDCTAVLETARRGSTPRRAATRFSSSGCAGLAFNPAKVEVQVRFLARTLMTLEPDGTAAACKAALQWVRLPPASLDCSTAGSDYICTRGKWSEPNLRRVVLEAAQLNVGTTSTP